MLIQSHGVCRWGLSELDRVSESWVNQKDPDKPGWECLRMIYTCWIWDWQRHGGTLGTDQQISSTWTTGNKRRAAGLSQQQQQMSMERKMREEDWWDCVMECMSGLAWVAETRPAPPDLLHGTVSNMSFTIIRTLIYLNLLSHLTTVFFSRTYCH